MRYLLGASLLLSLCVLTARPVDAQGACQKCIGPIHYQTCVMTYQAASMDCVVINNQCIEQGGACQEHSYQSPDGSTALRGKGPLSRDVTSRSMAAFLVSSPLGQSVHIQQTSTGKYYVDCKNRVVGRVEAASRVAQIRKATHVITL